MTAGHVHESRRQGTERPERRPAAREAGPRLVVPVGGQNNFVGNLLGGNSVSGILNLGMMVFGNQTPTGGDIASVILSGGGQGLPGDEPGGKGAAGQASDAIVGGAVSAGYNAITGVGGQALSSAASGVSSILDIASDVLNLGLDATTRLEIDGGLFALEAVVCAAK